MTEYSLLLPRESGLQVLINGTALGALQDYELVEKTELFPVRAFGCSEPVALVPGEKSFRLTLKRLLLRHPELPQLSSLYDLTDFTLEILDGGQSLTLTGCRWCSTKEHYVLAQGAVEELQLSACSCTRTTL